MTEKAPDQNESMEDILHSIRRIIANDPESPDGATAEAAEDDAPLELTEVVDEGAAKASSSTFGAETQEDPMAMFEAAKAVQEVAAAITPAPPAAAVVAAPPPPPPAPPPPPPPSPPQPPVAEMLAHSVMQEDSLLSGNAADVSAMALKHLVDSIPKPQVDSVLFRSGATLEALVVESIKPMLAEWLNKNLPTLVQSIVEKEIHKLLPKE